MSILFKKVVRTMLENKRSYVACILIIAVGMASYSAFSNVVQGLYSAKEEYYRDFKFADVFSTVTAMPINKTDELKNMKGIEDVSARLIKDVRVVLPQKDKIITLRLIGVDADAVKLNNYFVTGNNLVNDKDLLLGKGFFDYYKYKFGDTINLIISGRIYTFNISGMAQSPEYVYTIPDNGGMFPDSSAFDIAFVKKETLEKITNSIGIVNNVAFKLSGGTTFEDIKSPLESELKKYGMLSLVEQKNQVSNFMLGQELTQLQSTATSMPSLFLIISAVILYIVLRRVIEQERTQVGTLKAFGYSNREVLFHYLQFGFITGFLGGTIGSLLGIPLSSSMLTMYTQFFNFPHINATFSSAYIVGGTLLATLTGVFAAFMAVKSLLKLSPADAMRPASPNIVNSFSLDGNFFVKTFLNSTGRMSLRYIFRNKMRSIFILLSITISFGIMSFIFSYNIMMDQIIFDQLTKVQIYDLKVGLKNAVPYNVAIKALSEVRGIDDIDALLEVPVTMKYKNIAINGLITSISEDSSLYKIIDDHYKQYLPPKDGIILNKNIAKKLGIEKNSVIEISTPMFKNKIEIRVADVISQNFGSGCYIDSDAFCKIFGIEKTANSIIVKGDSDITASVKQLTLDAKNVSLVEDKSSSLKMIQDLMASYNFMIYMMGIIAVLVSFAIIYNISSVSLSERKRELATMRVLGLTATETMEVVSFEHWLLCFIGIIIGIPFSNFLKISMAQSLNSDMYSFPTVTPLNAYIFAAISCGISVFLSNNTSFKKIKTFDLVDVLKERE